VIWCLLRRLMEVVFFVLVFGCLFTFSGILFYIDPVGWLIGFGIFAGGGALLCLYFYCDRKCRERCKL